MNNGRDRNQAQSLRFEADERPPVWLALGCGVQLVAVGLAGLVLTATIVVRTAGGTETYLSWAVFCTVVISGVCTALQAVRIGRLGAGYVLWAGPTGAMIGISVAALAEGGPALLAILVIVSSVLPILISTRLSLFRRVLTPTVVGTVTMLIAATVLPVVFGRLNAVPDDTPTLAAPLTAAVTAVVISGAYLTAGARLRLWAPLIGIVAGSAVAGGFALYDLDRVARAPWIGLPSMEWPGVEADLGPAFAGLLPAFLSNRLLRALVCLGLCSITEPDLLALTPTGRLLCEQTPRSMRSLALLRGRRGVWSLWSRLLDVVRTGKTAPELVAGKGLYEWLADDPDGLSLFNQAMTEQSVVQAQVVADAYDFSDANVIVDVGGGYGALLMAILTRHSAVRGVVFDRPSSREGAERLAAESGLSGRCRFVGGDFFESVPGEGDLYLLKSVLHNWDDDRSVAILQTCHTAMNPDSHLLLIERALPEQVNMSLADTVAVAVDLHMLLLTGGCERTERQHRSLLQAAGFDLVRILPTSSALNLIEARKAV